MGSTKLPWRIFVEWISSGEACFRSIRRVFMVKKTKYQEIDVVELEGLGKAVIIDGKLQSSISDEHWYHEALVHPAMLLHPNPRRVLVIGGGEGATIREVLKHKSVEKVVMVDLDEEMVKIAQEYLEEWHRGSFNDPRVELIIEDGRKYIERQESSKFDIVILDLVDPTEGGPAVYLYTREFYEQVHRVLADDGIMVTQATSPILTPRVFATIYHTVSSIFRYTRPYVTYVRGYNGLWGFVLGSKRYNPDELLLPGRVAKLIEERISGTLRFYDEETHQWMFRIPKPIRELIHMYKDVATDEHPVYVPI